MNLFLKPFVEELIELSQNGFDTTTYISNVPVNIKVHTLLAPVDSVARPPIQMMHQFNGDARIACTKASEYQLAGDTPVSTAVIKNNYEVRLNIKDWLREHFRPKKSLKVLKTIV